MPVGKHYGGHGRKVMDNMMEEYGPRKGKKVFYATENKRKKMRGGKRKPGRKDDAA